MRRIQSKLNTNSAEFKQYTQHNKNIITEFSNKQNDARFKRPQRDIDRLAKQNKMLPRERLDLLLDPGTPFLEFSSLAANMAYDGTAPSANCITGIGIVGGREVVINASDSSNKGGAWYPLTVKKIVRALDIAVENHLPVIHLCDSAGGFLPLQSDLFGDKYMAGRIFRNQVQLSKMGCKQLSLVFGHCTAGGAYTPALSDYSVIVNGTGAVFLGGPPLVKAATGEDVTVDELGGASMHTSVSGTCDYYAGSEREAIAIGREIVMQWEQKSKFALQRETPEDPYYDPTELLGIIPDDIKKQFDMKEVIARIVDGSRFSEYQPNYGETMICGFANIWGYKVGILGNNGVLFNDSTLKAAHFMALCNQNNIPLVFLQNITGYMIGKEYEQRGITKDGAKMLMIQGGVEVPKFTIMTNGSFGAGNYGMCGRSWDARTTFSWPQSQISVMGSDQAANTLVTIKLAQLKREGIEPDAKELEAIREQVLANYENQTSAYYTSSEIWDDGIISPVDTRNALGISISASLNAPFGDTKYGVLRL
ncbi:MAG: methylcrotonoyl-CoA carboxylase [Cellvibrionaceae bacterium]|nr:methylcrotonoyl-CoA carboxylase [Cellvibrionaceae bacterium]|tara:strand:- start:7587 stop:9194 length:1608 start_codon:yes stop_codon:yes gene_type:complete